MTILYRGPLNTYISSPCLTSNLSIDADYCYDWRCLASKTFFSSYVSPFPLFLCDDVSAMYTTFNHYNTKEPNMWKIIYIFKEQNAIGQVHMLHIPSAHQFVDMLINDYLYSYFCIFGTM